MTTERATHWDNAYANGDTTRSWYQPSPTTSLRLLEEAAVSPAVGLIDVGGGASTLVDALLVRGHIDLTVLDVSARGLDLARDRLRSRADSVTWIVTDLLNWVPPRRYAVWHDRAVFHFLTDPVERERYRSVLSEALEPGGLAMVGAFATSTVFLISYLLRFALTGTHKYPGTGWDKILYLVILFSHMVLAVMVLPLIVRSLWLAYQQKFVEHKKLVKFTWPIWLYVSVTGVVVYLMLYHIGPGLH